MDWIRNLIQNTGLLSSARWLHGHLFSARKSEWLLRAERDQQRLRKVLPELLHKNSNCIDIGAHKGAYLDLFLRHAPLGTHYAFEPVPELYVVLKEKYPGINVLSSALSDSKGVSNFHKVNDGLAWSGLELQEYPRKMVIEQINVQTDLLDEILPSEYGPDFIKIDVEGAEFKVLAGGKFLINQYKPAILFEHAFIHNKRYHTQPEKIFEFFTDCEMNIYSCDLSKKFLVQEFTDLYYSSYRSNYNRDAETNFIALKSTL